MPPYSVNHTSPGLLESRTESNTPHGSQTSSTTTNKKRGHNIRCPFTSEFIDELEDPVVDIDGYTAEREGYICWLNSHNVAINTRNSMSVEDLRPNRALRTPNVNSTFSRRWKDPMIDKDGNTYEREQYKKWIRTNKTTYENGDPLRMDELRKNRVILDLQEDRDKSGIGVSFKSIPNPLNDPKPTLYPVKSDGQHNYVSPSPSAPPYKSHDAHGREQQYESVPESDHRESETNSSAPSRSRSYFSRTWKYIAIGAAAAFSGAYKVCHKIGECVYRGIEVTYDGLKHICRGLPEVISSGGALLCTAGAVVGKALCTAGAVLGPALYAGGVLLGEALYKAGEIFCSKAVKLWNSIDWKFVAECALGFMLLVYYFGQGLLEVLEVVIPAFMGGIIFILENTDWEFLFQCFIQLIGFTLWASIHTLSITAMISFNILDGLITGLSAL